MDESSTIHNPNVYKTIYDKNEYVKHLITYHLFRANLIEEELFNLKIDGIGDGQNQFRFHSKKDIEYTDVMVGTFQSEGGTKQDIRLEPNRFSHVRRTTTLNPAYHTKNVY